MSPEAAKKPAKRDPSEEREEPFVPQDGTMDLNVPQRERSRSPPRFSGAPKAKAAAERPPVVKAPPRGRKQTREEDEAAEKRLKKQGAKNPLAGGEQRGRDKSRKKLPPGEYADEAELIADGNEPLPRSRASGAQAKSRPRPLNQPYANEAELIADGNQPLPTSSSSRAVPKSAPKAKATPRWRAGLLNVLAAPVDSGEQQIGRAHV